MTVLAITASARQHLIDDHSFFGHPRGLAYLAFTLRQPSLHLRYLGFLRFNHIFG